MMHRTWERRVSIVVFAAFSLAASAPLSAAIVRLTGDDFTGGAASRFGNEYRSERHVNIIYAKPTGALSRLTATMRLSDAPQSPMVLQLRGRDDDRPGASRVSVSINGKLINESANTFPEAAFGETQWHIPDGVLHAGDNELSIASAEPDGSAGNPPWCMISAATLAPAAAMPLQHFRVTLPAELRPFPEPSAQDAPRFAFRGIKGWAWTTQQYLEEIPYLKRADMNFLMNCYSSMFDGEAPHGVGWDDKALRNNWWEPLNPEKKRGFEEVVRACQANDITFCFAMHPQLFSKRPMDLASAADFEALFAHYAWMQSLGVKWFSISMDDVKQEHAGSMHAGFCNKFLKRLRERDPEAQLIFCPTVYANSMIAGHEEYLPALAREMNPDIYVFWTGPEVVPTTISRADAERFRDLVKHRLIIWDNYPVNDNSPTLHLGPITGRDPELCKVAAGYMGNALYPQSHAGRIPLFTMADFAANPFGYDPSRSIGQAIMHLTDKPEERQVLADLVTTYAGDLIYNTGATNFNAPQSEYDRVTDSPVGEQIGELYLESLESLLAKSKRVVSPEYSEISTQLEADVSRLRAKHRKKYAARD